VNAAVGWMRRETKRATAVVFISKGPDKFDQGSVGTREHGSPVSTPLLGPAEIRCMVTVPAEHAAGSGQASGGDAGPSVQGPSRLETSNGCGLERERGRAEGAQRVAEDKGVATGVRCQAPGSSTWAGTWPRPLAGVARDTFASPSEGSPAGKRWQCLKHRDERLTMHGCT
jgi:hypothetical protein